MSRATRLAGLAGNLGGMDRLHANIELLTPAGSNSQANSTPINRTIALMVSLSAITTRGLLMPVAVSGLMIKVINGTTTNHKVYPNTSAKLGLGATANAVASVAALKSKTWLATSRLQWILIDQLA